MPTTSKSHKQPSKKMMEGMEALRQIASTSLFLENEQNTVENNRIVPIIKEPDESSGKMLLSFITIATVDSPEEKTK